MFALVARTETVKLVVGLASLKGWKMSQLDVKFAFLNGPLEEEVYVNQPLGFGLKEHERKVYQLHKMFRISPPFLLALSSISCECE